MLSDLPDKRPNPETHAYGHFKLDAEEHLLADQSELSADLRERGAELVIVQCEEWFERMHITVTKRQTGKRAA